MVDISGTRPVEPAGMDRWCPAFEQRGFRLRAAKYKFAGMKYDSETGDYYDYARYYSPQLGRFMSPDPADLGAANPGNPQSWNRYAYAMNNPTSSTDPTGLGCVYLSPDGSTYEGANGNGPCDPSEWGFGNDVQSVYVAGCINGLDYTSTYVSGTYIPYSWDEPGACGDSSAVDPTFYIPLTPPSCYSSAACLGPGGGSGNPPTDTGGSGGGGGGAGSLGSRAMKLATCASDAAQNVSLAADLHHISWLKSGAG